MTTERYYYLAICRDEGLTTKEKLTESWVVPPLEVLAALKAQRHLSPPTAAWLKRWESLKAEVNQ